MNCKTVFNGEKEKKHLKETFSLLIERLGDIPGFVYLDSDLMSSVGTKEWADKNPSKAFNTGVAEANMAGIAAGLSASGMKPMIHTFASFASRRCFDQVFLSVGYAKNDVVIIGSDPGITAAYNGGTHMAFEDMALYRTIPNSTIIDITDGVMLEKLVEKLFNVPGPKYVRLPRKDVYRIYDTNTDFILGESMLLRQGEDVAVFACGIMVAQALFAAKKLEKEGINATVVDMFTVKEADEKAVIRHAKKCGAAVTAENHSVTGGLGSTIAEILAKSHPVPMEMAGVVSEFGEVGSREYLAKRFKLDSDAIYAKVKDVLKRKIK